MTSPITDELIWSRLSTFWTNQIDREAISVVYDGLLTALNADYARLHDINDAKSLATITPYGFRRWLQLDMTKYSEMRDWLRYVSSATTDGTCSQAPTNHARHWHINVPFTVADSSVAGRRLVVGFPIVLSGCMVWDAVTGVALRPGSDYTLSDSGYSLQLLVGNVGHKYEVLLTLDFSDPVYNGYRPVTYYVASATAPNSVAIPSSLNNKFPVLTQVITRPPTAASRGFTETNTIDFATTRSFVPFLVPSDTTVGATRSGGVLYLPVTVSVTQSVLVFGLEAATTFPVHQHHEVSDAFGTETITSWTPSEAPARGWAGTVGFMGSPVQLLVNGTLMAPEKYRYIASTGTFQFATAMAGPLTLTAQFELEQLVTDGSTVSHLHLACSAASFAVATVVDIFDDGDALDDGGTFDSSTLIDHITLPAEVATSQDSLSLYVNGVWLRPDVDYTISSSTGAVVLTFLGHQSGSFIVSFRRSSRVYRYGRRDMTGRFGYSAVPDNLGGLLSAYLQRVGSTLNSAATLLEGARIAGAGGNPLFALFTDEFELLQSEGLKLDAPGQSLTAAQARAIESADTQLIDIPYLVDHVVNPTVVYAAGQDFDVVDGEILSSRDLNAVWWCPLVVLDEQLLAKNFGALVGDVRTSDPSYRGSLLAQFLLRYNGATLGSLRNAAAAHMGSPVFLKDGKVLAVNDAVTGYTIGAGSAGAHAAALTTVPATTLELGSPVFTGLSLTATQLARASCSTATLVGNLFTVPVLYTTVRAGDTLLVPTADAGWLGFTITDVQTAPTVFGVATTFTLNDTSPYALLSTGTYWIFRGDGGPISTVTGVVTSKTPIITTTVVTDAETVTALPGIPVGVHVNEMVSRGQAVHPVLADTYDATSRPNWHWIRAGDWHAKARGEVMLPTQSRYITVGHGSRGYAEAALQPIYPLLPRGSTVSFGTTTLTVVGNNGGTVFLTPNITDTYSGTATIVAAVPPADRVLDTGYVAGTSSALRTTVALGALQADFDATNFPAAGRVAFVVAGVTVAEAEYTVSRGYHGVAGLRWTPHPAGWALPTMAATTTTVRLVATLADKQLNPAFTALVNTRVVNDANTLSGRPVLTDPDAYYNLLKATATVVEVSGGHRLDVLADTLDEVTPAGVTMVLHSNLRVVDSIHLIGREAALSNGVTAPTLTITTTLDSGAALGSTYAELLAVASITNGIAYAWTSTLGVVETPWANATRIRALPPTGSLSFVVSVTVQTADGRAFTASRTVTR